MSELTCPVCKFHRAECCCSRPTARWVDAPLNTNPHTITRDLEQAIGAYTGAPYVVTTTSCTQAILMALAWYRERRSHEGVWTPLPAVTMPRLSYVGVPASILSAGYGVNFSPDDWQG